ncbi:MAG: alpha/beta hydrolase [Saprospiraceae bacterium]
MGCLKKIGLGLAVLYLLLCAVLYVVQERIIFDPHPLSQDHRFRAGEEVYLEVAPDVQLNCLFLKEKPSRGVVLYLHGNRGNIRRCIRQARMMADNGYDIFIPDYRSYGKSQGQISSEQQLFSDVQKAYDYLKQSYSEDQIVIVGYSLGSGMASYLAANNQPKALALVAPYYSFPDLKNSRIPFLPDFILKYHLNNYKFLAQTNCPTTLFHGTLDEIIPYDSSVRLEQIDPQKISLVTMEGVSHRGAIFDNRFKSGMRKILQ